MRAEPETDEDPFSGEDACIYATLATSHPLTSSAQP